jgi:hypothetical protein
LASAQTDYQGTTELYTSGGVIANGQAVVLEYGASTIRAIAPSSMPTADQVIGIALNATATAGQQVRVLKSGFGSAALVAPIEVRLNSTTDDQVFTHSQVIFRDSGGLVGDYAVAAYNYKCVFDAGGGGTWSAQFVTDPNDPATFFSFVHSGNSHFDRLGIQTSSNGTAWTNVSVPWMKTSSVATAPWAVSGSSGPGWIVPSGVSTANGNGYVTGTPVTFNSRYLRFWFFTQSGQSRPGWNIALTSSSSVGAPLPVLADQPVYIDTADLNKVTLTSGGALIGRTAAGADASSDSILIRRPSDTGPTGSTGPQGVVGATGPQGAAGPSGSDADASRTQNITATPGVTIITGRIDLAQTSLALGYSAGKTTQSTTGIAIGLNAGYTGQAENAISLGNMAGQAGQGRNSIALGYLSGYYQQAPYSTVINSSGEQINGAIERGMYMAPIRNTSEGTTYALRYNPSTKEITYE